MFLPYHNARLTRVAGGGASENYDQAVGTDSDRWAGDAEAQILERVLEQVNGERLDQVKQTTLVIPSNLGIEVATGDTVTYVVGGTSVSRDVRDVASHPEVGIVRLQLENE